MANEKIVVIGGSGFLGSHIVRLFASQGACVTVIARHARQAYDSEFVKFLPMDLECVSSRELRSKIFDASVIINSTGSIWGKTKEKMESAILRPTRVVLDAVSGMTNAPRYIHLGSILETEHASRSDYGEAKKAASNLVSQSALDCWILQIANAVGPGSPRCSLVGRTATQLCTLRRDRDRPLVLSLGSLDCERDFVDVRDVSEAVSLASKRVGCGERVAVGSGYAVPTRNVVEKLVRISGVDAVIGQSKRSAGHSTGSVPGTNLLKARKLLGWMPRRDLENSLSDYWIEFTRKS